MADQLHEYLQNRLQSVLKFKAIKKAYIALFGNKKDVFVRDVLMDLKLRFGYYHAAKPNKELEMAFKEGQRSVILHILAMSTRTPEDDTEDIENMMKIINNEM